MSFVEKYISEVQGLYKTEKAREHAYRPAFKILIESLKPDLIAVNDPARSEHGAPDFVFVKGDLTFGYAETKDIGIDMEKTVASEQMERYYGYSNLILSDYLEFRFYRNGEQQGEIIKIAEVKDGKIVPIGDNFSRLESTITDFLSQTPEKLKSGEKLSKIMGWKARRIRENVLYFLKEHKEKDLEVFKIYEVIKKLLIHDMSEEKFSDMYAQTLVYGLFIARYNDSTPDNFTRQEARDLVPASNPFLQHFFDHIAGRNFDKRLGYIVNELCDVFSVADVKELMGQYLKDKDPVIHFYEDFLKEYDPKLRLSLGVFYTPAPVVSFIVRSIDEILQKEFGITKGLADTSKIKVKTHQQGKTVDKEIHRVQILDPAVGTGTFLNEVIRTIYKNKESMNQLGNWEDYVNDNLLPRLHGFEIMMASYTIAHLKLAMTLQERGYKNFSKRLGIYLTNSLEEGIQIGDDLFSSLGLMDTITNEANEAGKIKKDFPIMVVLGNPPYSISSSNKSAWIQNLIKDYKKDLGEKKINIDDDYIKFIRFAEYFIEKNHEGVVGMITNNSFIDGITHRQMRKHLLQTFDSVYIIDLHGNTRKGEKDQNVFDIMQGVSISLFVKNNKKKSDLGDIYFSELFGNRKEKYESLDNDSFSKIKWQKIEIKEPYYFFVPKDFGEEEEYNKGFELTDLFNIHSAGIKTKVDNISIDFNNTILAKRVHDIIINKYPIQEVIQKFDLNPKTTWEYAKVLKADYDDKKIVSYDYRPFDKRWIYYDKDFLSRNRGQVMDNFFNHDNIGLETSRVGDYIFVSKNISDEHFVSDNSFKFPLYIYLEEGKISNLDGKIVKEIEEIVGKTSPEDIFDYVYAVLHSPGYRDKYKEFLKIDFPRVPYPKDKNTFMTLVEKGEELRELHLLQSPKVDKFVTSYSVPGNNVVGKVSYENGKIFINKEQYFGDVPESAWNFYIGGYRPAYKWLNDRKGRKLSDDEIEHYQKIIVVLVETERIMGEIDKII